MNPLLLLTDFSESANHAVAYGYHLAKILKTNVVLCNAVDLTDTSTMVWPADAYATLMTSSEEELKLLKKHLEHADHSAGFHPEITCESKFGRLTDVVENLRAEQEFYMVVVGAHRSAFGRFLLENHSESMIDALNYPLLIVPKEAVFSDIKKIAFGTDFKNYKRDLDSIYSLIPIAKTMDAKILLVHIHKGEVMEASEIETEFLTEISNKANYPHIFYSRLQNHQPEESLCHLCDTRAVDIMVMLHRAPGFLDVLFNKSHTLKVAAKITVPLMVMRE